MASGMAQGQCAACRISPPEFERAVAFAPYADAHRDLLHLLKFDGVQPVAREILGRGMAAAIAQLRSAAAAELCVIPVPMYRGRLRRRGFNQSLLLAEAGLALLRREDPGWRLSLEPGLLERVRDTRELYPLAPHQRRAALQSAFRAADKPALRGREVLLIDDILTTGATARACARVLRRAGATRVWVATWARTLDPGAQMDVAFWGARRTPHPREQRAIDPG